MSDHQEKESFWKMLLRTARHLVLHNGGFKLIAILISVVLWAGLISQDESLTREKTFTDVAVNVVNSETMKRNGYIVVSDIAEAVGNVSAVAAVPQMQYDSAEASAYNVRLDLSRISGTGEQEVRLQSSPSTTFGRVTSLTPATVKLQVEDYVVRYRIPVSVSVSGEVPEGWYMSTPSVDPPLVVVSGPRSLVSTISRARVFLDPDEIEWEEGYMVTSAKLNLYNRSGEEVDSSLLEISYESIVLDDAIVESIILPTLTFETSDMISTTNKVAKGYEVKAVHISPESVTVAARGEVLSQMSELALSDHIVDLKGLKDTTTFQIKISKPSEDAVLSNDTITVTVEVEPVEKAED